MLAHGLGILDDFRGMQQRLGGNAADIETYAAQTGRTLDERHLHAEVGSAEGRRVPARARPQYEKLRATRAGFRSIHGTASVKPRGSDNVLARKVVKRAAAAPSITR